MFLNFRVLNSTVRSLLLLFLSINVLCEFANVAKECESLKYMKTVQLTEEQRALALKLAAEGEPVQVILEALSLGHYEFWIARQEDDRFAMAFIQARQEGLEAVADTLLTLADQMPDVQRARLKSENIRWILSKRKPYVYGDRIDVNVTNTVDVASALLEAKNRAALPNDYQHKIVEVEHREITDETQLIASDGKTFESLFSPEDLEFLK
jgi:hypothetical protein